MLFACECVLYKNQIYLYGFKNNSILWSGGVLFWAIHSSYVYELLNFYSISFHNFSHLVLNI